MSATAATLPQALMEKVTAVLPTPPLPKRFDESTPRTTPPLSPTLHAAVNSHDEQLLLATQLLDSTTPKNEAGVALDGFKLTLGEVVAASRFKKKVKIDDAPAIKSRIDESVDFLRSKVSLQGMRSRAPCSGGLPKVNFDTHFNSSFLHSLSTLFMV